MFDKGHTWNPWHGCKKLSEGCLNCYVYRSDARYDKDSSIVRKNADFDLPIRKNRQKQYKISSGEIVYTCFTSDFLLDSADIWRNDAWSMMRERSDLKFFFITKRIDRLEKNLPPDWGDGYGNVAIGCTCENQKRADSRLPIFINLPIKTRYIICEPMLEKINLTPYLSDNIHRVVAGGESGNNARICRYEWFLSLRDQCAAHGVNFWFKQTGYRFAKDNKLYLIERKLQHSQARKAGINFDGGTFIER